MAKELTDSGDGGRLSSHRFQGRSRDRGAVNGRQLGREDGVFGNSAQLDMLLNIIPEPAKASSASALENHRQSLARHYWRKYQKICRDGSPGINALTNRRVRSKTSRSESALGSDACLSFSAEAPRCCGKPKKSERPCSVRFRAVRFGQILSPLHLCFTKSECTLTNNKTCRKPREPNLALFVCNLSNVCSQFDSIRNLNAPYDKRNGNQLQQSAYDNFSCMHEQLFITLDDLMV